MPVHTHSHTHTNTQTHTANRPFGHIFKSVYMLEQWGSNNCHVSRGNLHWILFPVVVVVVKILDDLVLRARLLLADQIAARELIYFLRLPVCCKRSVQTGHLLRHMSVVICMLCWGEMICLFMSGHLYFSCHWSFSFCTKKINKIKNSESEGYTDEKDIQSHQSQRPSLGTYKSSHVIKSFFFSCLVNRHRHTKPRYELTPCTLHILSDRRKLLMTISGKY